VNPLTRLYRKSRAFRILCYVALIPVFIFLQFVAIDSFGGHSHVATYLGLAGMIAFAAWAWWWGDRHESLSPAVDGERGGAR
jgi:amino acid transporter